MPVGLFTRARTSRSSGAVFMRASASYARSTCISPAPCSQGSRPSTGLAVALTALSTRSGVAGTPSRFAADNRSAAPPATWGAAMLVPFQFSPRTRCQEGNGLHAAPGATTEIPRSPPGSGPRLENAKRRSPGSAPICA